MCFGTRGVECSSDRDTGCGEQLGAARLARIERQGTAELDGAELQWAGLRFAVWSGPVVMYRNRTEDNVRDMYLSAFSSGRMQARRPVHADGWKIDGCPTNSGRLAAVGDQVAAAWFTGAGQNPRINLAFWQGKAFSEPVVIDGTKPAGRVALAAVADQSVMVTWLGHNEHGVVLRATEARLDGHLGKPLDVAATAPNGKLGFPFVAGCGEQLGTRRASTRGFSE